MKNALILFMMIGLVYSIQAQNQTNEKTNNHIIVKKITIKNIDGKESRNETIDTIDAANWNDESLNDRNIEVIVRDGDQIEFAPGAGNEDVVINPEEFHKQWHEGQEEERVAVTPPNKAVMGVQLSNVDGDNGAQITEVFEGSAAEKAGLQEGDILLSVNGKETSDVEAVIKALSEYKPGDKVKVSYLRGTKIKNSKLTLQERKEEMMKMKSCSPSCMSMMKCCKPGEMAKCMKDMHLNPKMQEQMEKELQGLGKSENGKKKMIIIKNGPGQLRIQNNKASETGDAESKTIEKINQQAKEEMARRNGNQSLNVEYLTASPNPNNGQMKIRFSGLAVPTTVQVMDLSGKEIYIEKLDNFDGTYNKDIDIKNDARGTLILKIIQGDKIMTQKIIVE
jgi:type II secretory pathway component PulC